MSHGIWRQECRQISGRAWSCEPESLHYFSPGCDAQLFIELWSIRWQTEAAPNSKFCKLWVNPHPEIVFQAQFHITWRQRIWSILGQGTFPGPIGQAQGRCRAGRGGFTAQPQLNPCVKGHGTGRKSKYTALRHGQNGPPRRQKG